MMHDTHNSYIYENLPQILRHAARAGFRSYAPESIDLFQTSISYEKLKDTGMPSQPVPVTHQRNLLEIDYGLTCRYRKLFDGCVPRAEDLTADEFCRMREFKERNHFRARNENVSSQVYRHCASCCALGVGGTRGCTRLPRYNLHSANDTVPHFQNLPQPPFNRVQGSWFHEQLDRCDTGKVMGGRGFV